MTESRAWDERVYEVFSRAVELPDDERLAFVDEVCDGDAALRDELLGLLGHLPKGGDRFLEGGAMSAAAAIDLETALDGDPSATPLDDPDRVGPYRIVERLGEGGMGVVYLAEQENPRRRIALKVIKPGMDTQSVVRRFERERQALAVMDHPGIARIHDAGATPGGRPYFAMEWIDGQPFSTYCDGAALTARLTLFRDLCDAVQHAHQKGIVHRDLKPSNVLVAERDGQPRPVVIDFGIARATSETDGDRSQLTRHQEAVGTYDYMAPEQALGAADVDSRADIYGLGVMLFELLTGERPFESRTPVDARVPQAPSTRVGRSRANVSETRRLQRALKGELDWITLKALDADRNRRYASASELAADVSRYLRREPVLAGPPGTWYRLRTFVRRNRVPVAAAGLVSILIGVGAVITVRALLEARDQRDAAWRAGQRLSTAVQQAQKERATAVEARRSAEAVSAFMVGVLELTNPERGPNVDKRAMLDHAAAQIDVVLRGYPSAQGRAHAVIGDAYATLAEHELAVEHLSQAYLAIADQPEIDPLQLYEVVWSGPTSFHCTGRNALAWECFRIAQSIAVEVMWSGSDPQPEIARLLLELRGATNEGEVGPLVRSLCSRAEDALPDDDPRWMLLADQLHFKMVRLQANGGPGNGQRIDSGWLDRVSAIYRDRAGVRGSDERFFDDQVYRVQIAFLNREFAKGVELGRQAERQFLQILPATHYTRLEFESVYGLCLLEVEGGKRKGTEILDGAVAKLCDSWPRSTDQLVLLRNAIEAYDRLGDAARVSELRVRLLDVIAALHPVVPLLEMIEAACGPRREALLKQMRTVGTDALGRILTSVREEADESDAVALAYALVAITRGRLRSAAPDDRRAVFEYVRSVGEQRSPGLTGVALSDLVGLHLGEGDYEAALRCADAGVSLDLPGEDGRWTAYFRAVRGRCLDRLGRVGARSELFAGYRELQRLAWITYGHTAQAHSWLQDHEAKHGGAIDVALTRLDRLLRLRADPLLLREPLWRLVACSELPLAAREPVLRAAKKGVRYEPDAWAAHLRLGAARLRCDDARGALEALGEASRLRGDPPTDGETAIPLFEALAHLDLTDVAAARTARARVSPKVLGRAPEFERLTAEVDGLLR